MPGAFFLVADVWFENFSSNDVNFLRNQIAFENSRCFLKFYQTNDFIDLKQTKYNDHDQAFN